MTFANHLRMRSSGVRFCFIASGLDGAVIVRLITMRFDFDAR